jgi:hypothetical protein
MNTLASTIEQFALPRFLAVGRASISPTRSLIVHPEPAFGGVVHDSNLEFVYWHARQIRTALSTALPVPSLDAPAGAALAELVERDYIGAQPSEPPGTYVSVCSGPQVAGRARRLVQDVRGRGFAGLQGDPAVAYLAALFAWVGCVAMAKSLRATHMNPDGTQSPYDLSKRLLDYAWVKLRWLREESGGNPWVRFGVSAARAFEQGRGNAVVDGWVEQGSPYW